MTISANVRKELFEMTTSEGKLIRIKPTEAKAGTTVYSSKQAQPLKMWTQEEHERFLEAMEKYPAGPWKVIASFIGSKTTRQTMTHAQKYRQKISRWRRGLRHKGRKQVPDAALYATGAAGSSVASCSGDEDADYCAKENLFRAIEYVSGDDSRYSSPVRALPSLSYGAGATGELNGGGGGRSELFKLAELASFEVMKQEPPHSPAHPYEVKLQFGYDAPPPPMPPSHKQLPKLEFRPSREWCTRKTEIKLSPLRGVDGKVLSAVTGLSFMNAQNRIDLRSLAACGGGAQPMDCSDDEAVHSLGGGGGGAFRLPPLNMATGHVDSAFSIPPLRSKIDPSVLGHAQFATN